MQKNYLETEKLSKLMLKYAMPCVVSLLVGALYNIVDQLFIANASYLGSYGNAANTVVFPLTVIALAVAVMIGDGCCAFISINRGKGDEAAVNKSVGSAISASVSAGVLLTAAYIVFGKFFITLFGGKVNAETFEFAKEYFFYISLGMLFYVFGQAMNPVIRADGRPGLAMFATLLGALVNIILDPVFIFPLKMGMRGAAIATVIGQAVTAVFSLILVIKSKSFSLKRGDFLFDKSVTLKSLTLGVSSFLSQISLVAAMAAINNMIKKYAALDPVFSLTEYAQIPMAVVGIVMKFFQIVISVVVGMAAGCIPVVGYNMGAKRFDRVKRLMILLLTAEAAVGVIALIVAECFPKALINLFGAKNESVYYTDFAVLSFRVYLSMLILACVNKATFIFMQSMGKAAAATALSMVREIVFGVGYALLLPVFFGLNGVLYSMPAADISAFIITVIILIKTVKKLNTRIKTESEISNTI